jgi:hypothetical protein
LCADGFELVGPDLDGYAHRYRRAGLVVDVLAPEGIKPATLIGILRIGPRAWPERQKLGAGATPGRAFFASSKDIAARQAP